MMALLRSLELAYQGVNHIRRTLYREEFLEVRRLPLPVVSVGNIAMGGSGKTPTVIRIVELLTGRGLRCAVLSRGYGRESNDEIAVVEGRDAARFGDEPVLLSQKLPSTPIIVGRDRYHSGQSFLAGPASGCDVFVLDDGFQHLQLHRDVDIVIDHPVAKLHREHLSSLRDADLVLTRSPRGSSPLPADRCFAIRGSAAGFRKGGTRQAVGELTGSRVFAFAGLADNNQFFEMLEAIGAEVAGKKSFPDHHRYTAGDVLALQRSAEEAGKAMLITTEKDEVKLPEGFASALEMQIEIEDEWRFVDMLIELLEGGSNEQ